jgi:hypothetical protein
VKQAYAQLFSSSLEELCLQSTVAFRVLRELYYRHGGSHGSPKSEELIGSLEGVDKALPQAYVVLDALDECLKREGLLEFL